MKTVVDNALKKYIKSRQAPASESIKRFKEMNKTGNAPGIHPVFGIIICFLNITLET
jgi:hypothetical protein